VVWYALHLKQRLNQISSCELKTKCSNLSSASHFYVAASAQRFYEFDKNEAVTNADIPCRVSVNLLIVIYILSVCLSLLLIYIERLTEEHTVQESSVRLRDASTTQNNLGLTNRMLGLGLQYAHIRAGRLKGW